jgi:hypothetical protein
MRGARTDCGLLLHELIDKCEHVSLLASKLSTCKANKLFRSQFCIRKRMRGARTDCDCIDEICEIVAQGITATAIFIPTPLHLPTGIVRSSSCRLVSRTA